MSLRTPRHDFGPTASASKYSSSNGGGAYGATPRSANPYGTASLMDTPHRDRDPLLASSTGAGAGASTTPQQFDFLSHPLYSDTESEDNAGGNEGHLQFQDLYAQMAQFKDRLDAFVEESHQRIQAAADLHSEIREEYKKATREVEREAETEKKSQHDLWTSEW